MPVTEFLERNAKLFPNDIALVEINPATSSRRHWKDFNLVESSQLFYRSQISWQVFNEKANRCANFLISRGIAKGDNVALIMYNSIDWLPIYFGILKAGAVAVPFNFRYSADEISYCAKLAQVKLIFFGAEFIGRIEAIFNSLNIDFVFVGDNCPSFAIPFFISTASFSGHNPYIPICDSDNAAIYFSSGTTGTGKNG